MTITPGPRQVAQGEHEVERVERGFDHFLLTHNGALTLHDAHRTVAYPLPLDRARLGDLTIARGYYRTSHGSEYELRWPFGYDESHDGPVLPTPTRGLARGHHHMDWLGVVNALRAAREDDEGLALLLEMLHAAKDDGSVLAATWAERVCVILRRQKRYSDELGVIESTLHCVPARHGEILAGRLPRARDLAGRVRSIAPVKSTRRDLSE
ncbi:hypothetical protein [Cumulibacter soli]|uniref:hypothetical protein n=1 Tax=Cumulibacter soli TaxID=2546344 RepID=UPI0010673FB5|nr:hypothetical protein [Cumulibacter soli]